MNNESERLITLSEYFSHFRVTKCLQSKFSFVIPSQVLFTYIISNVSTWLEEIPPILDTQLGTRASIDPAHTASQQDRRGPVPERNEPDRLAAGKRISRAPSHTGAVARPPGMWSPLPYIRDR